MNVKTGTKGFISTPLEERFWAKVDRREADECWPWLGSSNARKDRPVGYGQIWVDGRIRKATQVSWEFAHGQPFPDGLHACHTCDNPICVNPAHIFPGTRSANARDALSKGRLVLDARKHMTHCKHGHEFSPENTYVYPNGNRGCRICRRRLKAAHDARARSALHPSEER